MTIPEGQLRAYLLHGQQTFNADGAIHCIGEIALPSGRVLCADPFLLHADLLRERTTPARSGMAYVQMIATATAGTRAAHTWLQLRDTVPVRWEEAMRFPVDSGLACFVDAELAAVFSATVERFPGNYYDERMAAGFRANATEDRPEGDRSLHTFGTGNMALCSSGLGDGQYTAYWGLDGTDALCAVLIDFDLGR